MTKYKVTFRTMNGDYEEYTIEAKDKSARYYAHVKCQNLNKGRDKFAMIVTIVSIEELPQ